MDSLLVPVIVGIIVIVLGVQNLKGNIELLHRYHRKRVSDEDRLPFGRKVGTGTVIAGCLHRALCRNKKEHPKGDHYEKILDFYLSLDAEPMTGWTVYRLSGETLRRMAEDGAEQDSAAFAEMI